MSQEQDWMGDDQNQKVFTSFVAQKHKNTQVDDQQNKSDQKQKQVKQEEINQNDKSCWIIQKQDKQQQIVKTTPRGRRGNIQKFDQKQDSNTSIIKSKIIKPNQNDLSDWKNQKQTDKIEKKQQQAPVRRGNRQPTYNNNQDNYNNTQSKFSKKNQVYSSQNCSNQQRPYNRGRGRGRGGRNNYDQNTRRNNNQQRNNNNNYIGNKPYYNNNYTNNYRQNGQYQNKYQEKNYNKNYQRTNNKSYVQKNDKPNIEVHYQKNIDDDKLSMIQTNQIPKKEEFQFQKSRQYKKYQSQTLLLQPKGRKCWPQSSIYIQKCRVTVTLRQISDFKCQCLVIPYETLQMQYYPGNIINSSPIDYKQKIIKKGSAISNGGCPYFQKAIKVEDYKALIFLKVEKAKRQSHLQLGITKIIKYIQTEKVQIPLDTIVFPIQSQLGDPLFVIKPVIQCLDKSKKIRQFWITADKYQHYLKAAQAFNSCLQQLFKNNQILTF